MEYNTKYEKKKNETHFKRNILLLLLLLLGVDIFVRPLLSSEIVVHSGCCYNYYAYAQGRIPMYFVSVLSPVQMALTLRPSAQEMVITKQQQKRNFFET